MIESVNAEKQPWTQDVWDVFVAPPWPLEFPVIGQSEWDKWVEGGECSGLWELQPQFPRRLSLLWDQIVRVKTPNFYYNNNEKMRKKVIREWEMRFLSPVVKLDYLENSQLDYVQRPNERGPASDHFLGFGEFVRLSLWRPSECRHPKHPQAGCEYIAREVVPIEPKVNMNYWLAQVQDGKQVFQALLECPLRVDLGSRGPVDICWCQQILRMDLYRPARKLDRYADALPLVIARAQIEGIFFRANRSNEDLEY